MNRVNEFIRKHTAALWVVGALLAGGTYAYQIHQDNAEESCQAQYNKVFTEQARIRSLISVASDKAQTDLIAGVGKLILAKPTQDPKVQQQRAEKYVSLFVEFNKVVDQVEKDRAANPLPEVPNC